MIDYDRAGACFATALLGVLGSCAPPEAPPSPFEPVWEVQHADSTQLFVAISIVDESTVWVSGEDGVVGRTTDGGVTWHFPAAPGGDSLDFRDVHAFSPTEAFILSIGPGTASRVYHTADAGESWTPSFVSDDPDAFYDCLSFWDRQRGFAFSDSHDGEFKLIRTTDGGGSWERIDPSRVPDAHPGEGAFASSGTCVVTRPGGLGWFVTGASGVDTRVIRTADYGETWLEAVTPIASVDNVTGITSLAFLDDRHGVAVGGFGALPPSVERDVAVTTDGGATWSLTGRTSEAGGSYGVSYVPGTTSPTMVAVSPRGSAYSSDNGRTWTSIDTNDYWTVAFLGPDVGWAAGRGHISRIARGGS